MEEMTFANCY